MTSHSSNLAALPEAELHQPSSFRTRDDRPVLQPGMGQQKENG